MMTDEEHQALLAAAEAAHAEWVPGHTSMTDLDPEERRLRLGYTPAPDEPTLEQREALAAGGLGLAALAGGPALPQAIDWRDNNGSFVTTIKDQSSCGSCVAFGTAATMESRQLIVQRTPIGTGPILDLSEAHLFYCGNNAADPCRQGWQPDRALRFATNTGVVPESCFPYTSGNQPCRPCDDWLTKVTKVGGSHSISNVNDMKRWLSTNGPLITCFTIYEDLYAYRGGIYSHVSGQLEGGHCVSCIGYDDAAQAWICKNSWGLGWGDRGFFRIKYGQVGIDATMWAVDNFSTIFVPPDAPSAGHKHAAGH